MMEKSTYIGLGICITIIVVGLVLFNSEDKTETTRTIQIDAKWFDFNPNEIRLKQGEDVTIQINNLDATHGINIPKLGIRGDNIVRFRFDKKGEFEFYCNNFCGEGHSDMIGKIIVE